MASPPLPPAWQVRITAPDGSVAGGGVIVPGDQVLTCVHVVNAALRRDSRVTPPEEEDVVYVDMPHHVQYPRRSARVVATTWNTERDTTLLRLDAGPRFAPARLRARTAEIIASRQPYPVRIQGYPHSNTDGLSVTAWVIAPGGDLPQRAQVDIDPRHPVRFEPGFSGCGVLDIRDGTVIGVLTSALVDAPVSGGRLSDRHGRIGLMEPVEMVEPLSEHTRDAELERVRRVLSDILFQATWEPYGAATRHRDTELVEFGSAWEAFAYLRDLTPRPDGLPCEVVFIEEIARKGVVAPAALRAYSDSRHPSEVPPEPLAKLREGSGAPRPSGAATLTISADPVPGDPDQPRDYLVSHWLLDGQGAAKGAPLRTSETAMRDTVLALIDETETRLHARESAADLRLEFILPFSLLAQPIAQWRLPAPMTGEGERIGASYEIVLHAHERLNAPGWERANQSIRRRTRELSENGEAHIYLVPPGQSAEDNALLPDRLAGTWIVLCVLGTTVDLAEGVSQLATALQVGLPGIAWLHSRDPDQTLEFQQRIAAIAGPNDTISHDDLVALPRLVREWRTKNGQTREYDPYDVVVILDLTDRIRDLHTVGILTSPKKWRP